MKGLLPYSPTYLLNVLNIVSQKQQRGRATKIKCMHCEGPTTTSVLIRFIFNDSTEILVEFDFVLMFQNR
jgi:hypothetical protein